MNFEEIFPSFDIRASRNRSRSVDSICRFDDMYTRADIDVIRNNLLTEGDVCVMTLTFRVFTVVVPEWHWDEPKVKDLKVRVVDNTIAGAIELALDWWERHREEYLAEHPTDLTPWKKKRNS